MLQARRKNKFTDVVTAASKNTQVGGKDGGMINLSAAIYLWRAIRLEKLSQPKPFENTERVGNASLSL